MKAAVPDIDAYVAGLPEAVRPVVEQVRGAIRAAVPEAEETISYSMPAFRLGGRQLVYFAAWRSHIGFYATPAGNAAFQAELAPYKQAKGSVHFPLAEAMPLELIARIARFRADEIGAGGGRRMKKA